MEFTILDSSFRPVKVIDTFVSLIWTKRYYTHGDFELYIPADRELLQYKPDGSGTDFFLSRSDDDSVMVIEKIAIQTDAENGDYFIISGRSLESILARRIVGSQTIIKSEDVVQGLKELVADWTSYIDLTIDDSLTVAHDLITQITGDVLLDAVSAICMRFGIGLKMTISESAFRLAFYQGDEVNVIFSPEFDNLISSKYVYDIANYANYVKVMGEGTGLNRIAVHINRPPQVLGVGSRQIYADARDISRNDGSVSQIDYLPMLQERGWEKLAEHEVTETFEAEINPERPFAYKRDWNLGDIVTVTNEYGITAKPRIVEIIECWDENGYTAIPTFDALEPVSKIVLRDSEGYVLRDSTGAKLAVKE